MSDLLSIGSSALTAYRSAIAAVGENVANAETPGFVRRGVVLREIGPGAGSTIGVTGGAGFNGVRAEAVTRAYNDFLAGELRGATSDSGAADARAQWLGAIENALGDAGGGDGVGARIGALFNAADALAAQPGEPLGRSSVLAALDDAAGAIRTAATALGRVAAGIGDAADSAAGTVNAALADLVRINGALNTAPAGSSARAALEDERDRRIDGLAALMPVTVTLDVRGAAAVTSGNAALLDRRGAARIGVAHAADGRIAWTQTRGALTTPLGIAGGTLGGLFDSAQTLAGRRAGLDTLAADFAGAMNAWSAAGTDAAGNPGAALLTGSDAASLAATPRMPADVPAASAGGAANGNLLALVGVRSAGGFETRWATMVAGNGQALVSARSAADAADVRRTQGAVALDADAGVDLDREAAELMRLQQAYSGSAKIIQASRDMLGAILDLF